MSQGAHTRRLLNVITELNLDARHPELADIRFMIEQGLMEDDLARDLLLQYDAVIRAAIENPNPLARPPKREEYHGDRAPDIEIGHFVDAPDIRWGLRFADRPRGVLISGNSGAGKTTTIVNIIERVIEYNHSNPGRHIVLIIMDSKLDYEHLVPSLKPDCLYLNIHDPGTRLSLAAPDGVPADVWINLIATCFCALSGMVMGWTPLANQIRWLRAAMNTERGKPLIWPSLKLLLDVMYRSPKKSWGTKDSWEDTVIGVLEAATQSTNVFDCFGGLDLERDVVRPGKHLHLEMPNVAPGWIRQFIIGINLLQLLCGRIHRRQKTRRTEIILFLDEMDQDASAAADQRFPDGMSPLAQVLRLGREYGIMVVIGMGRIRHASPYVLAEPQYHLILTQSDANSIFTARNTLALPPEADAMFPSLKPGFCIAREAQGPWPHPAMIKIDERPQEGL